MQLKPLYAIVLCCFAWTSFCAQAVDSFYKKRPLGSIGDFGCFSFHETKNIHCGEGGLISINNKIGDIGAKKLVQNLSQLI